MEKEIQDSIETITRFCRNNMNFKRQLPIRASEMGMLIYTKYATEPVTPISISKFFNISKPATTTSINSLVKNGYVLKVKSETDKRSFSIILTEKAIELTDDFYGEYVRLVSLIKKGLSEEEFNMLISLLKKSNNFLERES